MVFFGQFNDTKELLTGIYEDTTTNFTHNIEYEKLEKLTIGRTIQYVEDFFGPPEVIKNSNLSENVTFQYYEIEKAVVTIIVNRERVSGFVIVPIVDDFDPEIPYVRAKLSETSIAFENESESGFFFDASNLIYFAESHGMGKEFMFLNQVVGFVEYGEFARSGEEIEKSIESDILLIKTINDLFALDEQDEMTKSMKQLRGNGLANFYGFTELEADLIAESLLTRFEFSTYFGAISD